MLLLNLSPVTEPLGQHLDCVVVAGLGGLKSCDGYHCWSGDEGSMVLERQRSRDVVAINVSAEPLPEALPSADFAVEGLESQLWELLTAFPIFRNFSHICRGCRLSGHT